MSKSVLLASTSPRRIEMMKWIDIPFKTAKPEVDENTIRNPSPAELTKLLAEAKAEALRSRSPNTIIIGSDTVVGVESRILEKPLSKRHQREMIHAQKGKYAEVYSSICVIDTSIGEKIIKTKITPYKMAIPSDSQIEAYIETENGLDKAGGYGQQDENGLFVHSIDGCYTNAIGFPLCDVVDMLKHLGLQINVDIKEKVLLITGKSC